AGDMWPLLVGKRAPRLEGVKGFTHVPRLTRVVGEKVSTMGASGTRGCDERLARRRCNRSAERAAVDLFTRGSYGRMSTSFWGAGGSGCECYGRPRLVSRGGAGNRLGVAASSSRSASDPVGHALARGALACRAGATCRPVQDESHSSDPRSRELRPHRRGRDSGAARPWPAG